MTFHTGCLVSFTATLLPFNVTWLPSLSFSLSLSVCQCTISAQKYVSQWSSAINFEMDICEKRHDLSFWGRENKSLEFYLRGWGIVDATEWQTVWKQQTHVRRSKPRTTESPRLALSRYISASHRVMWCRRLLANSEHEDDTEDEIDEIFAKYKESLKGKIIANNSCLQFSGAVNFTKFSVFLQCMPWS